MECYDPSWRDSHAFALNQHTRKSFIHLLKRAFESFISVTGIQGRLSKRYASVTHSRLKNFAHLVDGENDVERKYWKKAKRNSLAPTRLCACELFRTIIQCIQKDLSQAFMPRTIQSQHVFRLNGFSKIIDGLLLIFRVIFRHNTAFISI